MNLCIDTHSHTIASGHAYSTIREMAKAAAEKELSALAITEHAPAMPETCGNFYFSNLKVIPRTMYGVNLLFGVELNILDEEGNIDLPPSLLKSVDIAIASIHTPCFQEKRGIEENTRAYIRAMQNPYIDIIGHPDDSRFPIDYEQVVYAAKETRTLLEVNNSSLSPGSFREGAEENLKIMLSLCKKHRVPITTGSDAHVDIDVGNFTYSSKILASCDFPEELIVTTNLDKLRKFLKRNKNMYTSKVYCAKIEK